MGVRPLSEVSSYDASLPRYGAPSSSPGSLWVHSAGAAPAWSTLVDDLQVDILVIGAGFTGLSTAIALLERGAEVAVVDAGDPGAGASGRNGGQVIPVLKRMPDSLRAGLGEEVARGLIDMVAGSADNVFDMIRRYDIDCDGVQNGWIQAARSERGEAVLRERCRIWAQEGIACRSLDAREVAELSGASAFRSGWTLTRAGSVQPLKYARGLAQAVQGLGGAVHAKTPIVSLQEHAGRWQARTESGRTISARKVVLATNGYTTGLWPGLRESVVPVYSMQVATEPLPADIGAAILPQGQTMTDDNHLVHYFRRDAQGRFIMGSRGPFHDQPGAKAVQGLIDRTCRMFPQLRDIAFPHAWAGKVAMTTDYLPHLHRLAPGVTAAVGFNGRGVALATTMGRILASATLDDEPKSGDFPITPLKPIPMHGVHRTGVRMMIWYYRLADGDEAAAQPAINPKRDCC